jgi:hypothetical protein
MYGTPAIIIFLIAAEVSSHVIRQFQSEAPVCLLDEVVLSWWLVLKMHEQLQPSLSGMCSLALPLQAQWTVHLVPHDKL